MDKPINIGIAGIQGYVGKALAKLVSCHPYLKLSGILVKDTDLYCETQGDLAHLQNVPVYSLDDITQQQAAIDVLLLATPPASSIAITQSLKGSQINIIDLSGAFRLSQTELSQWYGITHDIPQLINGAPYGLSPWGFKKSTDQIILANPGCYPTCALLALIPLLRHTLIRSDNIIIDAKSGISGAGKKANPDLMFCEMIENFFPYKIGKHQHIPEIKKALNDYTDKTCDITFITSILPVKAGISMSIYADLNPTLIDDEEIVHAIDNAYSSAYANYPLVKFARINQGNTTNDKFLLGLKNVVGTPNMHLGYCVDNRKILIFASIDNLLKGAASQAIENINALYALPLATGLQQRENAI